MNDARNILPTRRVKFLLDRGILTCGRTLGESMGSPSGW